eukprot:5980043-Amphidinium_carterae.1
MGHHGDDFLAVVDMETEGWLDSCMKAAFKIKIAPKVGPGASHEGEFLHRRVGWTEEGFYWEHDSKYVAEMAAALGLDGKTVNTPGVHSIQPEMNEKLGDGDVRGFRSIAGTLMYLAQDRPDIQYATKEVLRGMSEPEQSHLTKAKRVVKYLQRVPLVRWKFVYQSDPGGLDCYSDSNWAAAESGFRSTSGGWLAYGKHVLDTFSSTQHLVAMSSAEAEYIAMTKVASHALELKHVMEEIRQSCWIKLWVDSKAARAIAHRVGVGKVRHLAVRLLWLQEATKKGELSVHSCRGTENPADIGTKHLPVSGLVSVMSCGAFQCTGQEWSSLQNDSWRVKHSS